MTRVDTRSGHDAHLAPADTACATPRKPRSGFALCAAVIACVVVGACGGDSHPTAPSAGAWQGSGSAGLGSAVGVLNIRVIEVRIDGTVVGRSAATGQSMLVAAVPVSGRWASGRHTLTVLVVDQASSPHTYNVRVDILFFNVGTQHTQSVSCHEQQTLATGQSASCQFTLP